MTIDDNAAKPWYTDRNVWIAVLIVVVAVAAVHGRSATFPFSSWDDPIYVRDNPVLDGFTGANVKQILTPGKDGVRREMLYIPVTYLSWLAECSTFGKNPTALHLGNVVLHLVNSLLLLAFLNLAFKNPLGALFGTLVFAVHPLQVEPVSAIMGRKDLLATFFSLLSLITYARFLESENKNWIVASVALFALAVFAKPSVILLPLVFAVLDYRKHGKWLGGEWGNKLPYAAIILIALLLHQQMPTEKNPLHTPPPDWFRLIAVPFVLWQLLAKAVFPVGLLPIYPWPEVEQATQVAALGALALVVIGVTLWIAYKKRIDPLWQGLLIVALLLAPAMKVVVDYREFITADRYAYLPFVGLSIALIPLFSMKGNVRRVVAAVAVAVIVAFGVQSFLLAHRIWGTPTGVSDVVLARYPNHLTTRLNRAIARAEAGDLGAEDDFLAVLKQAPNLPEARQSYAIFLRHKLAKNPKDYLATMRMAELALAAGDLVSGEGWLRRAIAIDPETLRPRVILVRVLQSRGRLDDARNELGAGLKRHPDDPGLKALEKSLKKSEPPPTP